MLTAIRRLGGAETQLGLVRRAGINDLVVLRYGIPLAFTVLKRLPLHSPRDVPH